MTPFRELVDSICLRPAMYVGHSSLVDVSHYLAGYCHALGDNGVSPGPFEGFIRWVEMRFVISSPAWHWTRILVHIYGDEEACFKAFPTLYDEFLSDRDRLGKSGIEAEAKRRLVARYGREWGSPDST